MSIIQIGGQVAGISISAMGARVTGEPLEDTLENLMHQIATAEKCCKFVLGDLMNAASRLYGDKYARWADITGLEIQSLRDIASTCNRVPIDMRRAGELSFAHHREVAALAPVEQVKWLQVAENHNLSRDRLVKSIKLGRIATSEDMTSPKVDDVDTGYENAHPFVNRLSSYLSKKERLGEYEDMNAAELYRFHLDLFPAVNRWSRVISRIKDRNDERVMELLGTDLETIGLSLN